METEIVTHRMRKLIGKRFYFSGQLWLLVEVLQEERQLVLTALEGDGLIQADLYGQATRRLPETLSIDIMDREKNVFSKELLQLLEGKVLD